MSETDSKIVYRKDYKPFPYSVDSVDLDFVLDAESTLVTTTMRVRPKSGFSPSSLHLDADELLTVWKLTIPTTPSQVLR